MQPSLIRVEARNARGKLGTSPFDRLAGREKLLALGAYPDMSLKLAREKRDVTTQLEQYGVEQEVRDTYRKMFNKGVPFDGAVAATGDEREGGEGEEGGEEEAAHG